MKFCTNCGKPLIEQIPFGDDRVRYVCPFCNTVHYENPKMVVGCIPEWKNQILLCKRAIEPGLGKWTLPAGYLEKGESVAEGARREAWEEAYARLNHLTPYGIFNLAFVSQVYIMFRGQLIDTDFRPGEESLSVRLFNEDEIPWADLAFTVIEKSLTLYFHDRKKGIFAVHMEDIEPRQRL